MTEKEICQMCAEYSIDIKCEFKDRCKLITLIRENKKLKEELKAVKKEFAELKSIRSWELCPDRMGK